MKITGVRTASYRFPMAESLWLGHREISSRNGFVLGIDTDAGLRGEAIVHARGLPLVPIIEALAPALIGSDPILRAQTLHRLKDMRVTGVSYLAPALALIDTALWDITAKAAAMPLHQLLGGFRNRIPVAAACGYRVAQRGNEAIRDEVAQLIDEGFAICKVMITGRGPKDDIAFLEQLLPVAGSRLAIDIHRGWTSIPQAMQMCRAADEMGLAFIEDPFWPSEAHLVRRLQAALRTPIAFGEDSGSMAEIGELVQEIGYLRVDSTVCGISGAIQAIHTAASAGCGILPHYFPMIHGQLAGAFACIEAAEIIVDTVSMTGNLLRRSPKIEQGMMHLDDEPGIGLDIDWNAVEAAAVDHAEVRA